MFRAFLIYICIKIRCIVRDMDYVIIQTMYDSFELNKITITLITKTKHTRFYGVSDAERGHKTIRVE